ncbi:flippase [Kineococcus sp. SYSU DK001]|uniref:flippase n=1 Tax=Kineococcus sp. SYSU DK001 TaxID=3383122 RepID=UPI003D7CF471
MTHVETPKDDELPVTRPRKHGIFGNGMWAAGQQAVNTGLNAAIGVALIATLPIAEYGAYAYGVALASIGMSVMSAGLSGLAVKALVMDEPATRQIVASLILIREVFAVGAYLLLGAISLTSGNSLSILATLVACSAMFCRAFEAPTMWFSAHMRTPAISRYSIAVNLGSAGVRVLGLVSHWNIAFFLAVYVLEALVSGVVVTWRYLADRESPGLGRPSWARMKSLLGQSYPLMISGLANQLNLRSDIVVIQTVLGVTSVATYAAAARFSEIAYFLPTVFMNATLPVLLRTRKDHGPGSPQYRRMLQRSYDQSFWFGVLAATGIILVGGPIIDLVFGPEYAVSKSVLVVHVLACPFVFMAAVYSKWIIAENRLWLSVIRHAGGAVVNIALNLVLLPRYGVLGAAYATVGSYVLASYVACFIDRASRPAALQMTLAIVAPIRYGGSWLSRRWTTRRSK